ncbi:MAG TPA: hypothetical protein VGP22_13880 [Albitalea sp.]|nr:hypothetical protein [Albitalea sp.]
MSGIGMLARWIARPGRNAEAGDLLRDALPLVMIESGTLAWFPLRFAETGFGVFASFRDLASRRAHLDGAAHELLWDKAPLVFDGAPRVDELDIVAEKLPPVGPYGPVNHGLLLSFEAKPGMELQVRRLLQDGFEAVREERGTVAWFGLSFGDCRFGSFAVFAEPGARFAHLAGHLPAALARHALSKLDGMPHLELPQVLAAKIEA